MSETATPDAVFIHDGARFETTELARGPWSPDSQHGGAPAALLMRAFERLDGPGLAIARVTYEFVRPVPLGHLVVDADVAKPGRRVQLLEGSIRTSGGTEVVRARAVRVMPAVEHAPRTPEQTPPRGPEHGRSNDFAPPHRPMFTPDAIEIRFVAGAFYGGEPSTAWFRLRAPIVAGEEPSPLQRLAAAGDFGNGISATLSWDEYSFINPDLTLYIHREPVGEWVCLEAQTIIAANGIGTAESVLYDTRGRVGRATQSLLVAAR
jgi:Thioesterase-like superfamily